ncbi:1-deoxy-D-xylulose-5-phosphate synthase [Marinicella sp. S1101]|uniref:1-deoxy-D-xylulose-5-phosphate synthase n=1 Tax=Marinicella marina TaxID=2996016 RepID=UPI002260A699|nr:1-deoxy-D-xylulose-5-phosphate synthase [Marinicella marina]MCX7553862.1 1-deoxy-D-xylulose-5-phosphate synthase [Marinicella marina]MDJ1140354.1 1-deoxy-D-xylulose-5-phosphate synthase [Marinicella marina]
MNKQYPLLDNINIPADLRKLNKNQLPQAADEVREFLIDEIAKCGGHFGSGLGTVELTVALHYVFNTPHDRIVWDVGHQAYPHKILTGRKEQLTTIKQKAGLAPFPKRTESEYDTFGVGHSSTSIGAALGMSLGSQIAGTERDVVAVIGDGAMTAGMAYEALNHGGELDTNMLVVLNENEMSISPNVGALSRMLIKIVSGRTYNRMREKSKRIMRRGSWLWKFMSRWEEHTKGMFVPNTLFEELGFHHLGPIDGHDVGQLVEKLEVAKEIKGPKLLHIITKKGKGYKPAEEDPIKYHAVGKFNPAEGIQNKAKPSTPTYTEVFGQWLCDMARIDNQLVAITPAMREGSGLVEFSQLFPKRYFDVGIAEQHAVTLAAGMACEGIKPVVAIYSTFLQRAYDQLVHDVAIQNLNVLFAIDRSGVVGPDGATHAGNLDISYLRCVPNMVLMAPSDENECRQMLYTGHQHNGPAAVRYPRGKGPGAAILPKMQTLPIGKADQVRKGDKNVAILSFGALLTEARAVAQELDASLVNMRFIKPLDKSMIEKLARTHNHIVTIEDNVIQGGAGSAVNEALHEMNITASVLNLGLPDSFQDHGTREELLQEAGLDVEQMLKRIKSFIGQKTNSKVYSI